LCDLEAAEPLGTSRNKVDGLLKWVGVYLDYTLQDLDTDRETTDASASECSSFSNTLPK
jgi:hypothetical protein